MMKQLLSQLVGKPTSEAGAQKARTAQLSVECLGERIVPTVSATLIDGSLLIQGDETTSDDILVRYTNKGQEVEVLSQNAADPFQKKFRASSIAEISFFGKGGNDVFDASGIAIDVTAYGGNGNDTLRGGAGHDALYGEAGHDRLYGNGGWDILDGGSGRDFLDGGQDRKIDLMTGGEGNDTFRREIHFTYNWYGWGYPSYSTNIFDFARDYNPLEDQYGDVPPVIPPDSDPPVATDDNYTISEDAELTVNGPGLLANDTDPNGDVLTAALETGPNHGSVAVSPNGSFSYTPDANFAGTDSFTYRASDGYDYTTATVTITVAPVADAPIAAGESYIVNEGMVLEAGANGVLANDSDPDGDGLSAVLVEDVAHGSLTLHADGSFAYAPDAGYVGSDSFVYRASDGSLLSSPAVVTIEVLPVASSNIDVHLDTGGTLSIIGDELDNNIEVVQEGSQVVVYGLSSENARLNTLGAFDSAAVHRVHFEGKAGDDRLDATSLMVSVTAYGGVGNDILLGGSADDSLYGDGARLHWNDGNDVLRGGAGNDSLFGGGGSDQLHGESGNDYLSGGIDWSADQLWGGSGADVFLRELYYPWTFYSPYYYSPPQPINNDYPLDFNSSEGDQIV